MVIKFSRYNFVRVSISFLLVLSSSSFMYFRLQTNAKLNPIKQIQWHGYRLLCARHGIIKAETDFNVYVRGIDLMCIRLTCITVFSVYCLLNRYREEFWFAISFGYDSVMTFATTLAYYRSISPSPYLNLIYFMFPTIRKPDGEKINLKLKSKNFNSNCVHLLYVRPMVQ